MGFLWPRFVTRRLSGCGVRTRFLLASFWFCQFNVDGVETTIISEVETHLKHFPEGGEFQVQHAQPVLLLFVVSPNGRRHSARTRDACGRQEDGQARSRVRTTQLFDC